jgi:hypothetical protein
MDQIGGDLPDSLVSVLRIAAEQAEGLGRRDTQFGVQDALGLLDQGPRRQPGMQAVDHAAAGPVQRGIADGGAALGRE